MNRGNMKHGSLCVLVCILAFIPAQAQNDAPQHAGHPPSTKAVRETKQRPAAKDNVYYSCPMHPSVKSKSKGRCPKCGMDLRLVRHEVAQAQDASHAEAPTSNAQFSETSENGRLSKLDIPDVEVLDQNGRKIHFYTDLVKGKTVAINFIFTTCTTICPPLAATFARVQRDLGAQLGKDVYLISISVDPATDTPERLKAWGAKFRAGDGWTFITGNKPQVDELLRALGASTARREDHTPAVIIGNDARGSWTRAYGLAKPSQLVQMIKDAMAGKATDTVERSK
jgi:cytochrome oxidase Cu insertion factor (SCO1/SenC/PrrC family)